MKFLFIKSRAPLSLSATLAIAFLTFGVLVLAITSSLQLFFNFQSQQIIISGTQQLVAQEAARSVSSFIQEKTSVLETANWLTEPASSSPSERKLMLGSLLGLQPSFYKLTLLDAQDRVLAQTARIRIEASGWLTHQLSGDVLARIHRKAKYISPVHINPYTSEPMVTIAIPVVDVFRDFKGSLVVDVNLKFMWDLVQHLKVGETGHAYVVDRQGNLIASWDTDRVLKGENSSHVKVVREFIRHRASVGPTWVNTYQGIEGTTVVGTYVPLETPDWAVVTELPWEEAYREVVSQAVASIAISVAMAFLSGVTGVFLARRLAVPLVHLMETAVRIAGGEWGLQALVSGPQEVAGLATAFNSMTTQLRQSLETLEKRVMERTAELESTNSELEAFSYSVAHDLRAPLRAIDGYTRILMEDHASSLAPEGRRLGTVVRHETRRMAQLIDDLLAFSRLSRAAMHPIPIDMASLANLVYQEMTTPQDRQRIDFHLNSLPPSVGDPTLLRQVWINLLSNAVKFSSKRERALIEINGRPDQGESCYSVHDNGVGFDMKFADKLFGVFQRLHSEQDFEGTGVGMAIVQRIIRRHGGRVWAESRLDHGATFYFTLPRN